MAPDCIGDKVAEIANGLGDGDVMLLENVRFYPAETKNDAGERHERLFLVWATICSGPHRVYTAIARWCKRCQRG